MSRLIRALALVSVVLLTACGSGGGDGSDPTPPGQCSIQLNTANHPDGQYTECRGGASSGRCITYAVIKPMRVEADGVTVENEQVEMTAMPGNFVVNIPRCTALQNVYPVKPATIADGGPLYDFEADCVASEGLDVVIADKEGECIPLTVHVEPLSASSASSP